MAAKQAENLTKEEKELQAKRDENQEVFDGLVEQFGEEKAQALYDNLVFAKRAQASGASIADDGSINFERDARATQQALHEMPHVWLSIPAMEEDPDPDGTVYVGLNEQSYHIRKGQRVCVPKAVIDILRNAVVEGVVPGKDQFGRVKRVRYQRVPFQYEGDATPEEAADFRREMARGANQLPPPSDREDFELPVELQ